MTEVPTTPSRDPALECHACGQLIATTKDRFCATCGARLMRADLRSETALARPPAVPTTPQLPAAPEAWVIAPAPRAEHHGIVIALAASVLVGLLGLAVAIILAVSGGEEAVGPVTTPTIATTPATVTIVERR